jgi:hypothetical protein
MDGQVFRLQKNLFVCIRKIRSTITQDQMKFVDSICVNQGELQERKNQVMLMGCIYQGTQNVSVGLGLTADKSEELYKIYKATITVAPKRLQSQYVELFGSTDKRRIWCALIALTRRRYWTRAMDRARDSSRS